MTSHDSQTRAELITEAANLATAAGAPPMQGFLQDYYRHVPVDELRRRTPEDLLSLAVGQRELARHRPAGTASVRCFNPTLDADGWTSSHTVVQIVTDDMPFLVDSVNAVLATMNRPVHLVIHPVLQVERDATGDLVGIIAGDAEAQAGRAVGVLAESWMHVEIDRESHASDRDEIEGRLRAALSDVREAVEDWPKMQARARQVAADITADPPAGIDDGEAHEAVELLAWLADNHFTFLAARDYRLGPVEGGTGLIPVPGSGLGLLRSDPPMGQPRPPLNETVLRKAREPRLVFVTKANSRATVHRPVYMDYVGVKTFDEHGTVVGERRFLGLFTASAYAESILRVPFLADKVTSVLRTAGYSEGSHSAKDLLGIFEEYPPRRALPGGRRSAAGGRHLGAQSRGEAPHPRLPAARRLRPVRLGAGLHSPGSVQHRRPAQCRVDPEGGRGGGGRRIHHPGLGIPSRASALRSASRAGHSRPRCRRRCPRGPHRRGHPDVG